MKPIQFGKRVLPVKSNLTKDQGTFDVTYKKSIPPVADVCSECKKAVRTNFREIAPGRYKLFCASCAPPPVDT